LGKGQDIVLIHGLGASQGFWGPHILLPLARRYRVTLFDLRGHGYSHMPSHGYSLTDFATDLHHLLDRLNIEKADLIGHSFGGAVALQAAVLFPERIRSLVVADTRVRCLHSKQNTVLVRGNCATIKKLEKIGLSIPEDEEEAGLWLLERFAASLHANTLEKLKETEPFIPFVGKKGKSRSAERLLQLFQATSARDEISKSNELTLDKLSAIRQPILAMCGESMLTNECLQGLRENIDRCHTVIFPEAGHFFPLTHSELFVKTVTDFLGKVSKGEFRDHERYLLKIPVQIQTDDGRACTALTVNICSKGLLVDSPRKIDTGTNIQISIMFENNGPTLFLPAKVVRLVENLNENIYHLGIELLSVCNTMEPGKHLQEQSAV
jgi:pimeloyl-ACP methyl ester carboxylesterase